MKGVSSMAVEVLTHQLESIGTVAGIVWNHLEAEGPVTLSKLAREVDVALTR